MDEGFLGFVGTLVVLLVLLGCVVGGCEMGKEEGRRAERAAAVKAGVARYVADPATGAVRFEYRGGK